MRFTAIYVHIPFCLQKCRYCDFLSFPGQPEQAAKEAYLRGLRKEFSLWQRKFSKGLFAAGANITLYFGGGTPSLMSVDFIGELIAMIRQETVHCGASMAEVTLEVNPGTIEEDYLNKLKEVGVTRISLGAQSFDDTDLSAMGRLHKAADTQTAVALCRACGFENLSIDLISNLPGQTVEAWLTNLEQAVALGVDHISCYGLHLSEGSPWGRQWAEGRLSLPGEDEEVAMWQQGRNYLQAQGYEQYEISNFARAGKCCLHNLHYWHRENYLGLGLGAASCYENTRWSNVEATEAYDLLLAENQLPVGFHEVLSDDVVLAEGIFLGLRCTEGIAFAEIKRKYGAEVCSCYGEELALLEKDGLLILDAQGMRLSPRGQLLANTVFAAFLPKS